MKQARLPLLISALLAAHGSQAADDSRALEAVKNQWTLLEEYCVGCHNYEDWAGSVAFDSMLPEEIAAQSEVWEEAIRKMRGRLMPPPGNERPEEEALDNFVASLETYLDNHAATEGQHPGHIAIHRLNRTEYRNSIEDLLGLEVDVEDLLPRDTVSDGFNNVANVLQVSPSFLEQYMQAARAVSLQAVADANPPPDVASFEAPSLANQYRHAAGLPLGTRGGFASEHF